MDPTSCTLEFNIKMAVQVIGVVCECDSWLCDFSDKWLYVAVVVGCSGKWLYMAVVVGCSGKWLYML